MTNSFSEENPPTILHVDFEETFRGGENQVWMLHEGLIDQGWRSFCLCLAGSEFDRRAKEKGLPGVYAVKAGGLNIGEFAPALMMGLREIAGRIKPQIIHAHSAHAGGVALWSRPFFGRVAARPKLVAHRRVSDPIGPFSKWKYNAMDLVIAVCGSIRDSLVGSGVKAEKIRVVPSGIRLNGCEEESKSLGVLESGSLEKREGQVAIGTMCALDGKQKDVATLIRAFGKIGERAQGAVLHIFGDGADRPRLQALTEELGLQSRVWFHGWWTREPGEALRQLDIFVLPSLQEGTSNVLMSAMAQGVACIANDVGGNPEVLSTSGLLVAPGDPEALAGAIGELLGDKNKRSEYSKAASYRAKTFSVDRSAVSMIGCYKELLSLE
ncbi:MAG: glycosyltransferase [Elusimicrobia bacterium]|nr:glycosyltransferase [Elusimicrobiota bacterium]